LPVQPAGVIVKDFLFDRIGDQIVGAEDVDGVTFARRVGVAVVGADHQVVLAGIAQNFLKIVVGFRGDDDV
jgi:hypothetical protein